MKNNNMDAEKPIFSDLGLQPLVIVLCKYCRAEINTVNTSRGLYQKRYCSEWCEEMENPPVLNKLCSCGNSLTAYIYKSGINKGFSTGMYPKYCEECQTVGNYSTCGIKRDDVIRYPNGRINYKLTKLKNETTRITTRLTNKSTDN